MSRNIDYIIKMPPPFLPEPGKGTSDDFIRYAYFVRTILKLYHLSPYFWFVNNTHSNLPDAFQKQMQEQLGIQYLTFLASLSENPVTSIRLNMRKGVLKDNLVPVPWCASGKYLQERPVFTLDPAFHGGAYYVQEASSMFLEQAIAQTTDLSQSLNVLDLCAAPGGKSTHLLSLLSADSLLVSNEVIRSRATILSENVQKWGQSNCIVTNNDPEHFKRLKGFFDVIVVDAPCSGEGLFRKDPESINEWSPENVDLCCKRQQRIIDDVWPLLKSGGLLVYCTCTYNRKENEANLHWLNTRHDAEFLSIKTDPSWGIQEISEEKIKGYHCYPHLAKGEGFFLAAVRKTEEQESAHWKKNKILQRPSAKVSDQLNDWVTDKDNQAFLMWKENLLMIPAAKLFDMELLISQLHIVSTGTTVAEVKHDKLIPNHAFALSNTINTDFFQTIELSTEQALQYLRKETLSLSDYQKGFTLMLHEGLPIGWANMLENRMNNMYPANWRIRMGK